MRNIRATLSSALVIAIASAWPSMSRAQGAAPLDQVKTLNAEAMAAFDGYSYKKGRKKLLEALAVASNAGLSKDAGLAATYVLLGVASVAGKNDIYRGMHYFVRALRLHKGAAIPARVLTPQLKQVFAAATRAAKAIGPPPVIVVRQKRAKKRASGGQTAARGLVHSPIDEVKRGFPIPVKAIAGVDVRVHRVYVFFRPAGRVKYTRAEMQKKGNVFRGSIPAKFTKGRYVHYYIEARDPRGRLAATNGSARGPNVVIVTKNK